MTRAREESLQVGTRRGIAQAVAVTGGVITSAGVVLAATFSALWVIPLLFLAQIAFIVAFGVLLDTIVTRSILVPSSWPIWGTASGGRGQGGSRPTSRESDRGGSLWPTRCSAAPVRGGLLAG
nr:MMPL family transporter [Janibacter hoylei]